MKRKMIQRKCIDCSNIDIVRADGVGKRCRSCRAKENSRNRTPKDMIGKISGDLKVLSFSHIEKNAFWKCLCRCGNECIIQGNRLRSKKTKSCGCIVKTQKGKSNSGAYHSWRSMIQRCYDKSVEHYKRYGAKDIKVCDRWINSFSNFLDDMGERPFGKTLDRINSKGNYEKENCRWATIKQQTNNTNRNFNITFLGKTQTLMQWSEQIGINCSTLRKRIVDLKWSIEKSLTQKIGNYATSKR